MTRRRAVALGGVLVVVVAAATAAWFARPVAPPATPAPVVVVTVDAPPPAPPVAAPIMKPPAVPAVQPPVPALPAGDDPASLLARAKGGDVVAMRLLGNMLLPCRPPTLESVMQKMEGGDLTATGEADPSVRALCEALPPDERVRALHWIEQAAVAGDAQARGAFLEHALDGYFLEQSVVADIDEIERRRDLARRFVREAMADCVPGAFAQQTKAFTLLGMADPVERMAVLHAAGLEAGSDDENPWQPLKLEFARETENADVAAVAEAERRGQSLYARCAPARRP